jgi:hypothetical protein
MHFVAIKMGRRLGKRIGGSAYRRIGVWGSITAFRHAYSDNEVSMKLTTLCKRRHADTPIRRHVSPSRIRRSNEIVYNLIKSANERAF